MTSQPIRTAVAGFGLSGSVFHTPFIASNPPAYELAVIATSDEARQTKAKERYPATQIVNTPPQDILHWPTNWTSSSWAPPPATHFPPLAKAALEAGLDVVVDKPFTVRSAEGEELIQLAAKLGRVLTVYQNRRWDGDSLTVKKLLDAGTLGTVTRFEVGMERWAPEIAKAGKPVPRRKTAVVSCSISARTSLISLSGSLGRPPSPSQKSRPAAPQESADDDVFLALQHESGVVSHVTINLNSHLHGPRFRILGTEGGFVKFGTDPQEPYVLRGGLPKDAEYGVEPPENHGTLERNGQRTTIPPTERGAYPRVLPHAGGKARRRRHRLRTSSTGGSGRLRCGAEAD